VEALGNCPVGRPLGIRPWMAAKINWHRYGTKVRHCHLMYRLTLELHYFAPASALGMIELFGRTGSPISRGGEPFGGGILP